MTTTVRELLKGCRAGRIQSCGLMQIVPLLSEFHDERFAPPDKAHVSTSTYGTLVIDNKESKPTIMPAGATYLVDQSAQNHALPHCGCIKAREIKRYNTAMCVQQSQGGTISAGQHPLRILPATLREQAHRVRTATEFGRLWPAIADFNKNSGLPGNAQRGHLEHFFDAFKEQLEGFVAQFEPVPEQVGAIIIINGKVAGIERTPSTNYFNSIWRPLIRDCYGSMAVVAEKNAPKNAPPAPPKTRVPLRRARTLDDLARALDECEDEEKRRATQLVESILNMQLTSKTDRKNEAEMEINAVEAGNFVGQVVQDGDRIVYASLVGTVKGASDADWLLAENFKM